MDTAIERHGHLFSSGNLLPVLFVLVMLNEAKCLTPDTPAILSGLAAGVIIAIAT